MPLYLGKTIRVHWFSFLLCGFLTAWPRLGLGAEPAPAAALGEGIRAAQQQRWTEAVRQLRSARARLPQLADHVGYWLAWAEFNQQNHEEALRAVQAVWKTALPSPLAGKAALLAARIHLELQDPRAAIRILEDRREQLPQPEREALLAAALEAARELTAAAVAWQRVYYRYPASGEAGEAEKALARLRERLGERYPPAMPQEMLERAEYWMRARQYRRARAEYEALTRQLGGRERELARVRVGAALFRDYETGAAWDHLRSFEAADPEADAERLYYLVECARRMNRDADMAALLDRLTRLYPRSSWRLRALISAGNRFLLDNQPEQYLPLFQACWEGFADDPDSRYCQWKVAVRFYVDRREEASRWLREHLVRYPSSEHAPAAMYFLGRLAEAKGRPDQARAWYEAVGQRFPNYYYAGRANQRLAAPEIARSAPSPEVTKFLAALSWPERASGDGFHPTEATRLRLTRARLLKSAGLTDAADEELKFGARTDGQPYLAALQWAELMRGELPVHQVLRTVKGLAPGHLNLPIEQAPKRFWEILFPLPNRHLIETYARRHQLDPFLVAGLIRQESEFNPGAVSPARAYGLMQILPSQGRILARRLGLKDYRTNLLFQPATSLRLGTYFLRSLLDRYEGRIEVALAAYNAGPNRAERWQTWARFEEPAEFVEMIPFTETRTYVQAVLRNAELYRCIHSPPAPAAAKPKPAHAGTKPPPGAGRLPQAGKKSGPVKPGSGRR